MANISRDLLPKGKFTFSDGGDTKLYEIPMIAPGFGTFYWSQARTNIPVFFKSDYNPWLTSSFDTILSKLARDLTVDGVALLKNYISMEDVNYLQQIAINSSKLGPKFSFSENEKDPKMKIAKDIAESMRSTLWRILLQPTSPFYLKFHLREKGIPESNTALKDYFNSKGHWWRFMRYNDGDSMHAHLDMPGEIMSILYLSKWGEDYDKCGCLFASHPDDFENLFNICHSASPGDLVFVDGSRLPHGVSEMKVKEGQLGRLTLFVPGYPF